MMHAVNHALCLGPLISYSMATVNFVQRLVTVTASHVHHKKGVSWFSSSMHAFGSIPIHAVTVLHLMALQADGALLLL